MRNYKVHISTGHVTGYGISPISNENTLIKFVMEIGKKLNTWLRQLFSKKESSKTHSPYDSEKDITPLFI
ncbi:hypothetical protein [Flagellimonas eckloniae]|uniref:Uncharacterized protein n=1 Tax=Flagellimonas eckloniae TaxID=346185 RepID=A0A0Q1BVU5_9FLAO|nr:hypothetical protein [Allomuricauda eckloniae]KQC28631.1 hypothetical protein AAY42_00960 [Allomuricauda eckloniae]